MIGRQGGGDEADLAGKSGARNGVEDLLEKDTIAAGGRRGSRALPSGRELTSTPDPYPISLRDAPETLIQNLLLSAPGDDKPGGEWS